MRHKVKNYQLLIISYQLPKLFKGIALFTPGGDLIYSIDPNKQAHWHLHLCAGLQEIFSLPEPPHFLVPGYTATIDYWRYPYTQEVITTAELHPPVQKHKALLSAIFGTTSGQWQVIPWQEESCNPIILETYQERFPQLWEEHDLIFRFEDQRSLSDVRYSVPQEISVHSKKKLVTSNSYVLRLFIAGHNTATENTLKNLHKLLEKGLHSPYTLKVIDIFKHPEQTEANQVAATPTLIRVLPQPVRRIVGKFEDMERVLQLILAD